MTATGTIFEGYRLLRELGGGWLGQVYAAQNLDGAQVSALRVVAPELTAQPQFMLQFRRLFEKWRRLAHPGILTPGELMERDHRAYYGMTLAQSGSVRQLLQAQAREGHFLDLLIAVDIARQAAGALAAAHDANLMHGDLKPENLLLTPARAILGRQAYGVLVSDFGVGELQAYTHGTHDRLIVTTPAYMSPEQCRGVRSEVRSDLYALGVILYELLTNLVPFETRDLADAVDKHQHVAPIPPGQIRVDIPQDLEEVVLTCLAKDPQYRYRDAHDLENALQAVLSGLLPQGPRPTVVLPDIPEPPAPRIEPLADRTPWPRLQICDEGGQLLRVEPLRADTATLGRAPGNTIVLEHAGVSRHHLNIGVEGGGVFVTDLGSTNGTTLGREPLEPRARTPWPDGGILRVEPFWLRLQPPQRVVQQARIGVLVEDSAIDLKPGEARLLRVQLANTGRTVDHFRLEVEGIPETWVHNLYHEVQLNPGMTSETTLKVLVPREPGSHAATYPVKVLARSRENPAEFGFAPMDWMVLPFTETRLELTPRRRSAWRRTHYDLRLTNVSNVPITYSPAVGDDEGHVFLQSPWDMMRIPPTGDLRNIVPVRAILHNYWLRLREGVGKVRVEALPQDVTVQPGGQFEHRLQVRLPIRWIASPRPRTLRIHPRPDRGQDHADTVSLLHLPVIPLWLLPLLLILAILFVWWLLQVPTIVSVSADPQQPPAGKPFTLNFETRGTSRILVKPWNKTLYSGRGKLLIPQGITEPTEVQVIAYGRVKTAQTVLTLTPRLPAPVVKRFSVTPENITSGQSATLRWEVANVREVTLDPFGTQPAKGELKQKITADTTFRLSAQGGGQNVTQTRDVKVLPPGIDLFQVTPQQAAAGQSVTLRWRVLNASTVTLDPVGTVAASGTLQQKVTQDQTYTLRAQVGDKTVSRSASVKLLAPVVELFQVTPENARAGDTVTLRWKVANASNVTIDPLGTVPAQGEKQVVAQTNTAYRLSASNGQSSTEASSAVSVSARPPQVTAFTATPRKPRSGQPVTLTWQTRDAASAELAGLGGTLALPPSGSTTVTAPAQSAQLTLTARSSDGATAAQSLALPVLPPAPKPQAAVPPRPKPAQPQPAQSQSVQPQPAPKPAPVPAPVPAAQPKPAPAPTPAPTPRPVAAAPSPAPVPRIVAFRASPASVQRGQPVTLSWDTRGVEQVKLLPLNRKFPPHGSVRLTPGSSTTYILLAGSVRASQPVQVRAVPAAAQAAPPRPAPAPRPEPAAIPAVPASPSPASPAPRPPVAAPTPPAPAPRIVTFSAAPAQVPAGGEVTLRWNVENARRVFISGLGQVDAAGSATRTLRRDTQFTLRASRPGAASTQQSVLVQVADQPSGTGRLSGNWQHPFGRLHLNVRGDTVEGTFSNVRTGDEGRIHGTLSPSTGGSYSLSAQVDVPGKTGENLSFLVVFSSDANTFSGFYSARQAKERWCGWRSGTTWSGRC
ncbi:Serine/threonine protein kinase with FHA domain [Deinococcus phoenicis]|uniref:Serine/threonine protein kinase with FHA domain n=1 Tax=Deinococcus phoenicis TaxID=1476583 RepID=A0A016QMF7_9DEIO|nr:FHA domain-containing serine/threonine-protein kinase [Deinococcus phoenicis]EYB66959.1 Serine/threonine protein kinase with FHA domain [Deinococcus phoenicis]